MKRFRFDKILYIVLGAILCIGGVLLLPALTNWFDQVLGIIAGSLLLIYLIVSSLFIKDLTVSYTPISTLFIADVKTLFGAKSL